MKTKTWITLAGGTLALAALLAWAFAPRAVEVELGRADLGPFETTIDEDARTRLAERFVVSAPLAGRLQRVALREGDRVNAGSVVATMLPVLSPLLDERSLRELSARVGAAEGALAVARTRIGAAQVALERARVEQSRTEQLARQGFVAPTKIDSDRLATRAAQKELDAATEGEHIARHDLDQARAALGAVRGEGGAAGKAAFALRSPVAGQVLKVHQKSETVLALGAPVLEVGDTARLEVVAELLTTDALQAPVGSPVRVERWGGPGVLEAVVRRVEPAAFTKVSALGVEEQRVNVLMDITTPPAAWARLGDGYRVSVRIVTRNEARVLRVPVSAVFPLPAGAAAAILNGGAAASGAGAAPATKGGTAAAAAGNAASNPAARELAAQSAADGSAVFAVYTMTDGRARLQPVRLLARNATHAWLGGGVAEGTAVIVYPPANVADGVRVRAAKG